MKPSTHPVQPIDPTQLVSKALVELIPKHLWEGDWIIDSTNDIQFLEKHWLCDVGDYVWIAEKHRLVIKDEVVWAEYPDGENRKTFIPPFTVPFKNGRNIPPIGMRKEACRLILKIHGVGVRWVEQEDNSSHIVKKHLVWDVEFERMPDPDMIIDLHKRGMLK